jgi:hypothetical protein
MKLLIMAEKGKREEEEGPRSKYPFPVQTINDLITSY